MAGVHNSEGLWRENMLRVQFVNAGAGPSRVVGIAELKKIQRTKSLHHRSRPVDARKEAKMKSHHTRQCSPVRVHVLSAGVLLAAILVSLIGATTVAVAQTIGYADAIDRLTVACGKDIQTYCKGVSLGNNRIRDCLVANDAKVSAQCKAGYADAFALLQKRATAQASVAKICDRDIQKVCGGVQPGDGNILDCILRAQRAVSAQCNQAVTDAGYR